MSKKRVHVVPHPKGGWATRTEGTSRVGKRFDTQSPAIQKGRTQALRNQTELVIHGRDARIRDSNSYGNDPYPPKG